MLAWLITFLDIQTVLILVAVTLGVYKFLNVRKERSRYNLPPGPLALPIVGNILQFASRKNIFKTLVEYGEKYNHIFTIYIGSQRVVVGTSYDIIQEGLVDRGKSIIGRPNDLYIVEKIFRKKGVIWSLGDIWKDTRRFALMSLRDFGVGKKSLEERIQDEADLLMTEIRACNGQPFDPKKFLSMAVMNIMCGIIRGSRYEKDNPQFIELLKRLDFLFKNAGIQVPENFFPLLRFLPIRSPAAQLIENDNAIRELIRQEIKQHKESFDPEDIRDFLDLYLKMTREEPNNPAFTEENIFRTIVDLFLAGSETTASSLTWAVLYLTNFPDVQKRCQEEIRQVVGVNRKIGLKDRESLPYVLATIHEVQRLANIAPFTIPHKAVEDVEIAGYTLPKDTILLFSIYAAHHDPKYWKDSEKFDPSRWLNPDGTLMKRKGFIPFGEGARSCLGKPLSEMEMFLFLANVMQKVTFKPIRGHEAPTLEPIQSGVSVQAYPYEICAEELNSS